LVTPPLAGAWAFDSSHVLQPPGSPAGFGTPPALLGCLIGKAEAVGNLGQRTAVDAGVEDQPCLVLGEHAGVDGLGQEHTR
jgi:hypothetical protein